MQAESRSGLLYILLSSVGYAFFPVLTRYLYAASDLAPLDIVTLRFFIAVPVIWLGVLLWSLSGRTVTFHEPLPRLKLLLLGLLLAAAGLCAFFGLRYIDASLYVVLFFSYPAMVVLINVALGERIRTRGVIALVLTVLGVALTAPEAFSFRLSPESLATRGVLIALLNALVVALFLVINGRIMRGFPASPRISAWNMTGTWLVVIPLFLGRGVLLPDSVEAWGLLVSLAVFSTVVPVFALVMGTVKLGASRAAIVSTLEPVLSVTLAYFLLGESLAWIQIVGAMLIIASVLLLEFPQRRPTATSAQGAGQPL